MLALSSVVVEGSDCSLEFGHVCVCVSISRLNSIETPYGTHRQSRESLQSAMVLRPRLPADFIFELVHLRTSNLAWTMVHLRTWQRGARETGGSQNGHAARNHRIGPGPPQVDFR